MSVRQAEPKRSVRRPPVPAFPGDGSRHSWSGASSVMSWMWLRASTVRRQPVPPKPASSRSATSPSKASLAKGTKSVSRWPICASILARAVIGMPGG